MQFLYYKAPDDAQAAFNRRHRYRRYVRQLESYEPPLTSLQEMAPLH